MGSFGTFLGGGSKFRRCVYDYDPDERGPQNATSFCPLNSRVAKKVFKFRPSQKSKNVTDEGTNFITGVRPALFTAFTL